MPFLYVTKIDNDHIVSVDGKNWRIVQTADIFTVKATRDILVYPNGNITTTNCHLAQIVLAAEIVNFIKKELNHV